MSDTGRGPVLQVAPGAAAAPTVTVAVVMGVAGSGKTTIGRLLASSLGWPFADGDDFHPKANIEKMAAGTPLTDDDRWPWLDRVGEWMDSQLGAGRSAVVACSALKRRYRDRLCVGRPAVVFVYLDGSREVIAQHLAHRQGHFFRATMLDSQFADLEPPQADEPVVRVPLRADTLPETIAAGVAAELRARPVSGTKP